MTDPKSTLYGMILWILLPIPLVGQSVWGGAGFFYGGLSVWPGFESAIQQVSNTAETLGNQQYRNLGAEMYVRRNRLLVGAGVSALVTKRVWDVASQTTIESSASNVHCWVGWVAWQTSRSKLYPSVAPGLSSFSINSTASAGLLTTHVLDSFSVDVGLTYDWLVLKSGYDPKLQAGPMLSLRIGYRLTTPSNEWHGDRNGASLLTPIRYNPYGFFFTLGVGGGGFRNK
ncbi:hypothetical protein GCM10028805_26140 [Spirosoma harenae]